jgi:hypothetical protein
MIPVDAQAHAPYGPTKMRFRSSVLPVCALLDIFGVARADDRALAREHYQKGSKAFALGAYDEAVAEYSAAYRLRDDPALLYNLAQTHRLANHAPEALRFYKMYLTLQPQAANRSEVEGKIAELQKLIEQQKKTATAMPPDSVKAPAETSPPEPERRPETALQLRPHPQMPTVAPVRVVDQYPGRTKKIAGIGVAAVGVAALVCGIALSVVARGYEGDVVTQYDPGKYGDGQIFGTVGPILLGIGGAAAISGVVIAVLGQRESRSAGAAKVSVRPTVGPSGAMATLRLGF